MELSFSAGKAPLRKIRAWWPEWAGPCGLAHCRGCEGGRRYRPWLKIQLTAVSGCGLWNEKEFFIAADQTYVLENENDDVFLPDLVAQAKTEGI